MATLETDVNMPEASGSSNRPIRALPDALGKRKRRSVEDTPATEEETGPESTLVNPRPKRARRVAPKKPKPPNSWHLLKKDVPDGAAKTKLALETHIRALWSLPNQYQVPPAVTAADQDAYKKRFRTEADVQRSVLDSLNQNAERITNARTQYERLLSSLEEGGIIAGNIQRIGEAQLLLMFRTVAISGLERWAPDVISKNPESMYNLLHEYIALCTFEQVSISYGYAHIGHDMSLIQDFSLLRKIYRNFVFHYMLERVKQESRRPGSVAAGASMVNIYKRRKSLATARTAILKDHGFRPDVIKLLSEPEAHSDDELSPPSVVVPNTANADPAENASPAANVVYHVKRKEARSTKFKLFSRNLDDQARRRTRSKRTSHREVRVREDPDPQEDSTITALPKSVPIDWFSTEYWNDVLTHRERIQYVRDGICVALPKEEFCVTWPLIARWKDLPKREFMTQYGNAVLSEYNLPTAEQIAQIEEEDENEEVEEAIRGSGSDA